MKRVKGLKDFGCWCIKDGIYEINNEMAKSLIKMKVVKLIKDLGKYYNSGHLIIKEII